MTIREEKFWNNTNQICDKADRVEICGQIGEELEEIVNEENQVVFKTCIVSKRISENADVLPIEIPEHLAGGLKAEMRARILGELKTRFEIGEDKKSHLKLYIDVKKLTFEMNSYVDGDTNIIYLKGDLHKQAIYRKTPKRTEITDLLVEIKLEDGTLAYIPCITWHENARMAAEFQASEQVSFFGRLQSRKYTKKLEDRSEERTAYEVSIYRFE